MNTGIVVFPGTWSDRDCAHAVGEVLGQPARYVDHHGRVTERYPDNPSGSPAGMTALTTPDGRVTILMPHPERVFRNVQLSWHPASWGQGQGQVDDSPWMRLFRNARVWAASIG